MNKVNEAGYNEAPKFGPSQNNPPYISDDFQIGPNGAYEHNEIVHIQQQLIDLLYSQVIDLSMMSKIELGDDVIAEIKRLNEIIKIGEKENKTMTTQEKAKELLLKFMAIQFGDFPTTDAKQCALIAVDEIIDALDKSLINADIEWWKEVKQEIEKL
jgi:hypothetical protein